ncbi:hypothetical protein MPC4_190003 [Methylocella tundrae]|uniref:Uncharacterized protein n=1 Tax=Methylocella tundrae TaxID=227605 RepID=A0A8B6M5T6_METTU|nr:hypothetical protein MPC4_190003 [Methylocella tundrae]
MRRTVAPSVNIFSVPSHLRSVISPWTLIPLGYCLVKRAVSTGPFPLTDENGAVQYKLDVICAPHYKKWREHLTLIVSRLELGRVGASSTKGNQHGKYVGRLPEIRQSAVRVGDLLFFVFREGTAVHRG